MYLHRITTVAAVEAHDYIAVAMVWHVVAMASTMIDFCKEPSARQNSSHPPALAVTTNQNCYGLYSVFLKMKWKDKHICCPISTVNLFSSLRDGTFTNITSSQTFPQRISQRKPTKTAQYSAAKASDSAVQLFNCDPCQTTVSFHEGKRM